MCKLSLWSYCGFFPWFFLTLPCYHEKDDGDNFSPRLQLAEPGAVTGRLTNPLSSLNTSSSGCTQPAIIEHCCVCVYICMYTPLQLHTLTTVFKITTGWWERIPLCASLEVTSSTEAQFHCPFYVTTLSLHPKPLHNLKNTQSSQKLAPPVSY